MATMAGRGGGSSGEEGGSGGGQQAEDMAGGDEDAEEEEAGDAPYSNLGNNIASHRWFWKVVSISNPSNLSIKLTAPSVSDVLFGR